MQDKKYTEATFAHQFDRPGQYQIDLRVAQPVFVVGCTVQVVAVGRDVARHVLEAHRIDKRVCQHASTFQSLAAQILEDINASGYGLTLGVHSRIDGFAREIFRGTRVGNTYINRNMVGAVVGVNPFGGQGLSGTGPKAGGPHYLPRFASEFTVSNNIAAVGGNASLLSLGSD